MKYIIKTTILTLLLSLQAYAQNRNIVEEIGINSITEKIQEFLKSNEKDYNRLKGDDVRIINHSLSSESDFDLIEQIYQEWAAVNARWINDSLVTRIYDDNNNLTETVFKNWENTDWINERRISYQYDLNFNLIEETAQNWDSVDWLDYYKILRTYDPNNKIIEKIEQYWNISNWINKIKITYAYDSNNRLIEEFIQRWNGNTWLDSIKVTRVFDINNNLTIVTQNWNGVTWINISRVLQTYDLNGRLIDIVTQNWNGSNWLNEIKISFTYDAANTLTEELWQTWYGGVTWANNKKYTYSYDINNNIKQELVQEWLGPDPYSWKNKLKKGYIYGLENVLMEELLQNWSGTSWFNDTKCTYRYDGNSTWNELQAYRNEPKANILNRRESTMAGNLVRTLFYNNGEVGQWPYQPSGEWPKGTGQSYLDGVAVLIASEILAPGNNQLVHPLQTSYREWMDKDPSTGMIWGFEPVPGYNNPNNSKIAMSNNPSTWPTFWPSALNLTSEWDGHWYGYFGRDNFYADLETFFVMDDSQDKEWTRIPFAFYPLQSDSQRAGLGLRVEIRSLQWANEYLQDIVFWQYEVINLADNNYPKTFFGFYTDCGVGGTYDSEDDYASFNKSLDLVYSYDYDGLGQPGNWVTGYFGYAYLETPGNATNGIDDDDDGMIDERMDDGIDNDVDWKPFTDLNNNSIWDPNENEPLNDDVGVDGLGPLDPNYPGQDFGEGNGLPTDGEPNFDRTDKDESDQIGLSAVSIYRLGQGGTGGGWPKDDESMWLKMSTGVFDTVLQNANISMVFSSGPFKLTPGIREKFAIALIFGENLEDLIINKNIAQIFYNNNYKLPDSLTSVDENTSNLRLKQYYITQNYPNPFNSTSVIKYSIPTSTKVTLKIFNTLGQEIETLVNEEKPFGTYEVNWNAANLPSGVYFYRIQAGDFVETMKMVLLK